MLKKKFQLHNELIYIIAASLALAFIIFIGNLSTIRIILGLPFVLFFPGYVLIAALFVKKDDLDGIERAALSFGLSIAVVPLIGLALNYTPFGIRLTPVLISLIAFIVIVSGIAFFRRKKLSQEECYCPAFEINIPQLQEFAKIDKILSVLLVTAILFAIGSIVYVIVTPKVGEKFTEFYILGTDGKAEGYPHELAVSEKGFVITGITNHEFNVEKYTMEVAVDGGLQKRLGPIELAHEEKWENKVDFSYGQPKKNVKVEFLLYREGDKKPYRSLHLWVNVLQSLSIRNENNRETAAAKVDGENNKRSSLSVAQIAYVR
ncbi:MAG TPA: hypothetical protein DCW46_01240 [Desulfotomaculum sp.]|nr:hypothetical protein [Desulfotomaculum sp.]